MMVVIVIVRWLLLLLLLPIHLAGVKVDRQVPGPMMVVAVMLPVVFVTSAAVVFVLRRHSHVTGPAGTEAVVAVVVLVPGTYNGSSTKFREMASHAYVIVGRG